MRGLRITSLAALDYLVDELERPKQLIRILVLLITELSESRRQLAWSVFQIGDCCPMANPFSGLERMQ